MATSPTHYAKVLESLSVGDFGEVLHNDTQALLLQLCGQASHLLGPLDFRERANQLLSSTEHGHGILHSLHGNIYKLKKLLLRDKTN